MSYALIVLSVLSLPFRWLWAVLSAAYQLQQLRQERRRLSRLRVLETRQLELLEAGNSTLVSGHVVEIAAYIAGRSKTEPYVSVGILVVNGSVFTLDLVEPRLTVNLQGILLPMKETLKSASTRLGPGSTALLQFIKPLQRLRQ